MEDTFIPFTAVPNSSGRVLGVREMTVNERDNGPNVI